MDDFSYLSVCSGIEAATVAWHPRGWKPWAFSDIDKFPSAVLAHHYPDVPNLGDMTEFRKWPDAALDLLVGGTPCQSFSVAGLRQGLVDPRGNLALTFLGIADRYRPRWLLWENVPGVLSIDGGRAFGSILGGMAKLGYGFAYRILDAQFVRVDGFGRAVPQRRRRVFVVGYLGDWRRAAAVLFEPESLSGNSAPRRESGQGVAPTISSRPTGGGGLGTDFDCDGGLIASTGDIAHCLNAGAMGRIDYETETMIARAPFAFKAPHFTRDKEGAPSSVFPPLSADADKGDQDPLICAPVAYRTSPNCGAWETGDRIDALTTGTDPSAHLIAFGAKDYGGDAEFNLSPTLRAGGHSTSHANAGVMPAVAFQPRFARNGRGAPDTVASALTGEAGRTGKGDSAQCVAIQERPASTGWAVRRLTPVECERLQGFPDGYTAIHKAADGPRYKALGNSMAVNAMRWLGHRIAMVDAF